jgi:acetyl esterase/lipase
VLIQASAGEILRDDSLRMAARLEADGVAVTLQIWAHTPHVWQLFHGWLPEAQAALDRAADWFKALAR